MLSASSSEMRVMLSGGVPELLSTVLSSAADTCIALLPVSLAHKAPYIFSSSEIIFMPIFPLSWTLSVIRGAASPFQAATQT